MCRRASRLPSFHTERAARTDHGTSPVPKGQQQLAYRAGGGKNHHMCGWPRSRLSMGWHWGRGRAQRACAVPRFEWTADDGPVCLIPLPSSFLWLAGQFLMQASRCSQGTRS